MRMSHRMMRSYVVILALVSGPAMAAAQQPVRADEPQRTVNGLAERPNQVRGDEITEAQQEAVERGLAWLASRQNADGSFGRGDGFGRNAAIPALAGLAFMQAGNLPGRGKYGDNVERALSFILAHTQESGLIASDTSHGPMYGHGFATLFLAEVYGMTHDDHVKEKLQRAVRLIHRTQNPEGGWRYQPVPYDADISVTITQIMALRAAHDAGIRVEKDVVDRSIAYVRACQNADGGFSYMARQGGGSAFPRSAAGVASLYYAGVFEGEEIQRGLAYLQQFNPGKGTGTQGAEGHYYYGHYYAVQAMFLAGGEYWATWYPGIRDQLIARQNRTSGAWSGEFSEDYATAMALIILQMPNRYLPVYTGKGPGD
jgi:hypothetical protein